MRNHLATMPDQTLNFVVEQEVERFINVRSTSSQSSIKNFHADEFLHRGLTAYSGACQRARLLLHHIPINRGVRRLEGIGVGRDFTTDWRAVIYR